MDGIIARGAEAILTRRGNILVKRRIQKNYRLGEIDERLRKLRTRSEAKIMGKLQGRINVPKILRMDDKNKEIIMQFIDGKMLSNHLDSFPFKKQEEICKEIGKGIARIHDSGIIHGDLTTSNIILKNNRIFFVDFGLGSHSSRVEDKAVDLHLMRQALESKHYQRWQPIFQAVLEGYKESANSSLVLQQFKKVESRGRYKGKH